MSRPARDEGSILPLVIGLGAISLALVLVVVSATSLYLERKRLFTLADGAVLAAAEAYDIDIGQRGPALQPERVRAAVDQFVLDAAPDFEGLRVDEATATDARSATITLSAIWRPPIVSVFVPDGIRIDVTTLGRTLYR